MSEDAPDKPQMYDWRTSKTWYDKALYESPYKVIYQKFFQDGRGSVVYDGASIHRGGYGKYEPLPQELYAEDLVIIRDLPSFVRAGDEALDALSEAPRELWGWTMHKGLSELLTNATPYDLIHPNQYLRGLAFQVKDTLFPDLYQWKNVGSLPGSDESFFVSWKPSPREYESPRELRFAMSQGEPTDIDMLHYVRCGRISPTEAIIYAVQMPTIQGNTEKKIETDLKRKDAKIQDLASYFKETFPRITSKIDAADDTTFLHKLQTILETKSKGRRYNGDPFNYLVKKLPKNIRGRYETYILSDNLIELDDLTTEMPTPDEGIIQLFAQRKERMRRMNRIIRSGGVSPAALMSLTSSIKLLHQEGVRVIRVPTYMVFRQHETYDPSTGEFEYDPVDTKILTDMVNLFERVSELVDGVTITTDPEAGEYMIVALSDTLNSTNKTLSKLFENLDSVRELKVQS